MRDKKWFKWIPAIVLGLGLIVIVSSSYMKTEKFVTHRNIKKQLKETESTLIRIEVTPLDSLSYSQLDSLLLVVEGTYNDLLEDQFYYVTLRADNPTRAREYDREIKNIWGDQIVISYHIMMAQVDVLIDEMEENQKEMDRIIDEAKKDLDSQMFGK